MTACSIAVFVRFHERNARARLGFVPARANGNSRIHILLTGGKVVGRTLCNLGKVGSPFEPAGIADGALPCAHCFDRALTLEFRYRRKAEEQPGRL